MRIICHLGFPRTGSTFLQSNIFPMHREINLIGSKNYIDWNKVKINQNDLNKIAEENYDDNLENNFINKIDKNIIKYFDEKKINIISSERYTTYKNIINDFRDLKCLEISLNQNYKEVKMDFLIVLRNQYNLIKSYYYHDHANISDFLRIKKFKSVFNFSDKNHEGKIPLNLFLNQFDFNHLHNKLKNKFKKSTIKYLFYEDLMSDKNYFSDEFSNFCNLDKNYTKELFYSGAKNSRVIADNRDYFVKGYVIKITRSKFYLKLKKLIPFKNIFKNIFWKYIVMSYEKNKPEEEIIYKDKIKKYYNVSNLQFFKQTNLINKHNY